MVTDTKKTFLLPYTLSFQKYKVYLYLIGTEELGHLEMVGTIVYQLTKNLTPEQIKEAGMEAYFVDHTTGVFPTAASGFPFSAASMQVKGDIITDLHENLAADEKHKFGQHNIMTLPKTE